jgi:hypothetical protein
MVSSPPHPSTIQREPVEPVVTNIEILAFGNLGEKKITVFNYRKCRCEKTTIHLSCALLNVLYLSSSAK